MLLVLLSATSALLVPKFGLFINLVGAFSCTALAFVLPVYMYNKTHQDSLTKRWKFAHMSLLLFGCICGAISFIVSIVEITKAFAHNDPSDEQIANPQANNVITEIDLNHHNATAVDVPLNTGLKF